MTQQGDDDQNRDLSADPSTVADGSLFPTPLDGVRITQAQLADLLGVSRQAVNKQVRRGAVRVDADSLMPARRALADWRNNVDQSRTRARFNVRRGGPAAPDPALLERLESLERRLAEDLGEIAGADGPVPGSHAEARTALLRLQAERQQIALDRERGAVVEKADVERHLADAFTTARVHLEDLPWRAVQHIDCTDEQRAVLAQQLGDGVRDVLTNLSRAFAALDDGKHREAANPEPEAP